MRRLTSLAALLAMAGLSRAGLTMTLDAGQWVSRPASDRTAIGLTGSLTATGRFTSISLVNLACTGPSGSLTGATLNDAILASQQSGLFTGVLFYLPILPTTLPGVYKGSAQFRVRIGQTSSTSALTPFSFEVRPVPEPSAFAALALGGLAFVRRRR